MNKKEIEKITYDITSDIIKETDYKIVDVEYVKEGQIKYLRVYIDKPQGISIDDCSNINMQLSKRLDMIDPIEEQYFLEVSSPGIDRPFKTDKDFEENINNEVEIRLYKAIDGNKTYTGKLLKKDKEKITIDVLGKPMNIDMKNISKINKAVIIE